MTNETPTPRGDAQDAPQGLSAADRPMAGLRDCIDRLLRVERTIGGIDFDTVSDDQYEHDRWLAAEAEGRDAQQALDVALAALDARLARLARFVRVADDRKRNAFGFLDPRALPAYEAAEAELRAARAALTEEDLA